MKTLVINLLKLFLNILYSFMKMGKTKDNRVLFISRQSDKLTEDFRMVQEKLLEIKPDVEIITICHYAKGLEGDKLGFAKAILKSMKYLATSKVCVLDAYWPAVSLLNHKKELTVIQMWHALGKIKQSGWQTLGKESGRDRKSAELLNMHKGYDYIIAGGKAWNPFYCLSFNTTEDKLVNCGLPRIDKLLDKASENKECVMKAYPELAGKKIVVYAPTFRRNIELNWENLVNEVTGRGAVLIVKAHPNQKIEITDEMRKRGVYDCPEFSSVDMLSSADYLVTDYSAIAVEGAVLGVKTLYFVYDFDEYREKNGMNINLFDEMPGCVFKDAASIGRIIEKDEYERESLRNYQKKFLPDELGTSTVKIAKLIKDNM